VLPVGGVKEKVLAAHRAGIKTIILPAWNKKDLEDIPKKVEKDIRFHFVDKMLDVIALALENKKPRTVKKTQKSKS
jgi:ATP-dependent Lon protease